MEQDSRPDDQPIKIKKYANRRLYNTATSSYVTLDHLARMVKDGVDFVVQDAKSGDDITRTVLTQIIVEEESKGETMLPISFLRQLIRFYGDSLQALVPRYLEYSMHSFARNQGKMRETIRETMNGLFPFAQFEEMGKQNLVLFENAIKMFSPFYGEGEGNNGAPQATDPQANDGDGFPRQGTGAAPRGNAEDQIQELRALLNEMQDRLDKVVPRSDDPA
ncbi:MAG TPA: polyhydroxyalkanoate synthesis repressor PhaR [Rhodospirillales bacterium]|jgi:polyhydroxyalkanoate synthesis repressor PhaR|nr:polyhydroxyalkanoate synthesis repressor PhaR [Rhodospirillales bacterium]HJO69468.1 polyhydroxyalkanoate synthesis repressor PhaR [Rhodospirillales bacterium]